MGSLSIYALFGLGIVFLLLACFGWGQPRADRAISRWDPCVQGLNEPADLFFAPVYNKLGLLLSSPVVRNIIGGSQTKLHAGPLMRDGKILLVNLAQSLIGEDNAHFLGALLVSKIQLATMHNLRLGREERAPFTLYVDEFQNFVVSSFEKILSEAGKAGLSLVMANQFLEQLGEGLPTAIRSNAGTLISFRVSAQSGRALEGEFGGFYGAKELTDLERGQAVARLGRAGDSFLIHTFPPLEPSTLGADRGAPHRIREHTFSTVCRERSEVEAELRASDEALRRLLEEAAEAERLAREARKTKPDEVKGKAKTAAPPEENLEGPKADSESESNDFSSAKSSDPDDAVDEEPVAVDLSEQVSKPHSGKSFKQSRGKHELVSGAEPGDPAPTSVIPADRMKSRETDSAEATEVTEPKALTKGDSEPSPLPEDGPVLRVSPNINGMV